MRHATPAGIVGSPAATTIARPSLVEVAVHATVTLKQRDQRVRFLPPAQHDRHGQVLQSAGERKAANADVPRCRMSHPPNLLPRRGSAQGVGGGGVRLREVSVECDSDQGATAGRLMLFDELVEHFEVCPGGADVHLDVGFGAGDAAGTAVGE
jgi:hypothetical protein